jgi:uncharacterized protein YndB with AHSA1/START domain
MTAPEPPTRTLVVERELRHPAEKVWRALTESSLIGEWLLPNDFAPVVGHRFTLRTAPVAQWNGVVECQVLVVEPPRRLAYAWGVGEPAAGGFQTIVTWTLRPTPDGVLLRMEQAGFRADQEANYRGAGYGWQKFLGALEQVVARQP